MEKVSLNINELGLKARTKSEYLIIDDCGKKILFLPSVADTSIEFISDIIRWKEESKVKMNLTIVKVFKTSSVVVCCLSQVDGL